ncbi:hypothetical protein ACIBF1_12615 [Spirillospora sp. NPDC050679]
MRDLRTPDGTPAQPAGDERGRLARLLVIALGLLGFVVVPSTGAATASAGTAAGIRAGTSQPGTGASTRTRSAAKSRSESRGTSWGMFRSASRTGHAEPYAAALRPPAGAPAPDHDVAVPPPVARVRPSQAVHAVRAERPATVDAAPRGAPRGRAPPAPTGF